MLELPGGIIMGSENVYGCLRREFRAKGFEVTKIFGEDKRYLSHFVSANILKGMSQLFQILYYVR